MSLDVPCHFLDSRPIADQWNRLIGLASEPYDLS